MFQLVNGSFPVASRTETLGIGGDLEKATRFEITGKKGRSPIGAIAEPGGGSKKTRSHWNKILEVHK